MVLSKLALTKVSPSELNRTETTQLACPLKVLKHFPVLAFHSLTVLSLLPLAKVCPSGLNRTDQIQLVCPLQANSFFLSNVCHIKISPSAPAVAKNCPSGLNVMERRMPRVSVKTDLDKSALAKLICCRSAPTK